MQRSRILIVEDEVVIRTALSRFLTKQSYKVTEAGSVDEALQNDLQDFALVITDLRLPGPAGTELISRAGDVPVLVMTSYASMRSAVETMKLGAAEYIAKPFEYDEMLTTIRDLIGDAPAADACSMDGMIGECRAIREVYGRIDKVAPTPTTVLIMGESGTGKELVARAIHSRSQQAGRPMISLNCAAIPDSLIESELFGHEKGAFTGATTTRVGLVEAADGGTLFLDEIGELPLDAQARLLRVLQEGEVRRVGSVETKQVSVRLIAATHRDLKALTRRNEFREDLYYRLNVVRLVLPPLRERGPDIMALARHFLTCAGQSLRKPGMRLAPETEDLIGNYTWPGNIRELENSIERALILCDGTTIGPELLGVEADAEQPSEAATADVLQDDGTRDHDTNLSIEDFLQKVILENQDHKTETELAQMLGISRKSLWEKRQKLNIPRERTRKA
mgnify:CR=1 FL=1